MQNKPDWRCPKTVNLSDGSQLELNVSSTLVLTENVINPDGSRARTKVTLLNGLVSLLGQD